jgi:hypothetical protein
LVTFSIQWLKWQVIIIWKVGNKIPKMTIGHQWVFTKPMFRLLVWSCTILVPNYNNHLLFLFCTLFWWDRELNLGFFLNPITKLSPKECALGLHFVTNLRIGRVFLPLILFNNPRGASWKLLIGSHKKKNSFLCSPCRKIQNILWGRKWWFLSSLSHGECEFKLACCHGWYFIYLLF